MLFYHDADHATRKQLHCITEGDEPNGYQAPGVYMKQGQRGPGSKGPIFYTMGGNY